MLVVGAGLGRTGTSSLRDALNILGYKTYHWSELMKPENFGDYQKWDRLINDKEFSPNKQVWNKLFIDKGYNACTDQPSSLFYKELYRKYPKAKFILTVRDSEKWYNSYTNSVHAYDLAMDRWYKQFTSKLARVNVKMSYDNERYLFNNQTWGQAKNNGNKEIVKSKFEQWNKECIQFMKKHNNSENLLVFDVKEGWQRLCEFLDKPVPKDTPFPHSNKTSNLAIRSKDLHQFQDRINYAICSVLVLILSVSIIYFIY